MRKYLIILFLFISSITYSATYYVSTTGNDSRSTVEAQNISTPWLTWEHAFSQLVAGDILYVRGGTYSPPDYDDHSPNHGACLYNKDGTSDNHITISAYQNEIPILDCANMDNSGSKSGILLNYSSYIDIIGLTIKNVNEQDIDNDGPVEGVYIDDCDHIVFTRCTVTRCGTGFRTNGCNAIYFVNCDAYENADLEFGNVSSSGIGGYCDGFGVHNLTAGNSIYFTGCRAWNNSDDGWDCTSSRGYIYYTNCWAFENGHTSGAWTTDSHGHTNINAITGDGDGFKTGVVPTGPESGLQRVYTSCMAFNNDLMGFDESADYWNYVDMALYNCVSYNNGDNGYGFYKNTASGTVYLKNCIAYANVDDIDFRATNIVEVTNSWDVANLDNSDFSSLTASEASGARQGDGSLPLISFLHLASGSDCIGAGTDISITYDCDGNPYSSPPSLGPFEYNTETPVYPVYQGIIVKDGTFIQYGGELIIIR